MASINWNIQLKSFYNALQFPQIDTGDVEVLDPFHQPEVKAIRESFFDTYFEDTLPRKIIIGINPGRLGAGITSLGFTSPKQVAGMLNLGDALGTSSEPSANFVEELIRAVGGPGVFYRKVMFTSVCPFGFVLNGKNYNYYDDKKLTAELEPYLLDWLKEQMNLGPIDPVGYTFGKGKNFKYLKDLNDKIQFFEELIALPHPRWVMQYQYKNKEQHLIEMAQKLGFTDEV